MNKRRESFTGDGSTTQFTVTQSIQSSYYKVYQNGQLSSDFTLASRTFTFTSAPPLDANIVIIYLSAN